VTIAVYDMAGRELAVLTDQNYPAGKHQVILMQHHIPVATI